MQHTIPTPDLVNLERHRPMARRYRTMVEDHIREQDEAEQARKDEAQNLEGIYFGKTADFCLAVSVGVLLGIWAASLWVRFA